MSPAAPRESRAAWLEGLAFALLALLILGFGGDVVRASYHGFLHTTVGEAVLRDGLTPENPYHAGAPLRYYTLYPALGVLLGRAGVGPLFGFALVSVLAALLLPVAFDRLGRAFGLGFVARRAAFLSAFLGFNALGWVGFVALDGGAPVGRAPLDCLSTAAFVSESWEWGYDPRLQPLVAKFLNVSSYAISLPFALWLLAYAVEGARGATVSTGKVLAAAALALALNPLVAGFAGACAAVWLIPVFARGPWSARKPWLVAAPIAVGLALPFLIALFAPVPDGPTAVGSESAHRAPLANLIGPLLLLWVPGVLGLAALERGWRWRIGAGMALAAAVVLGVRMPWGNEYKFVRLAGLLWSIPVGAWVGRTWERGGRVVPVLLALISVPTTVLVVTAYVRWEREALPTAVVRGRLSVRADAPPGAIPRALLAAEAAADESAVVLMHPYTSGFPARGRSVFESRSVASRTQGHPLAPLLSHPLVVDLPQIHNTGARGLLGRIDQAVALWHGHTGPLRAVRKEVPPERALRRLRAGLAERPFLVVTSGDLPPVDEVLRSAGGELVAEAAGYALWSLPPLE